MDALPPLAAFQAICIALAAAIVADARKEPRPWRYILFAVAGIVGLSGIFARAISGQWPIILAPMEELGGSAVVWFIAAAVLYFLLRPFWKTPTATSLTDQAAIQYDDAELREAVESNTETLAVFARDIEGLNKRFSAHLDQLKLHMQGEEKRTHDHLVIVEQKVGRVEGAVMESIRKVEAGVSLSADYTRRQIASLYQALAAIGHRESLGEIADSIEMQAKLLTGPTDRNEHLDAEDWALWEARQSMWRNTLRGWCQLAECYAPDITEKVLDTPADLLKEKGVAQITQFPNSDPEAFIAYKTFWILLKNWREHRREAEEAVYAAAFQGATSNSRPLILGNGAAPNALASG